MFVPALIAEAVAAATPYVLGGLAVSEGMILADAALEGGPEAALAIVQEQAALTMATGGAGTAVRLPSQVGKAIGNLSKRGASALTHAPQPGARVAFSEQFSQTATAVSKSTKSQVHVYEVGIHKNLKARSTGDAMDIHHAPQQYAAKQTVHGYDPNIAPSIVLPKKEHLKIQNVRGEYMGSARNLLAQDIRNLRTHRDAPNFQLQELMQRTRDTYPEALRRLPKP